MTFHSHCTKVLTRVSGLAETFGWFGYSILEEMDMEEVIERLNERIDRLQLSLIHI